MPNTRTLELTATTSSFGWIILTCFFLAALADFLLFNHAVGWTLGLFAAIVTIMLLLHNPNILKQLTAIIITLLTLGQCFALVISPNNLSILLTVLGIMSLSIVTQKAWQNNAKLWLDNIVSLFKSLFCIHKRFKLCRELTRRPSSQNTMTSFIQGWLLPLIFTIIFLALFSQANPIIMNWFDFSTFLEELSFQRVLLWLGVIYLALCFLIPDFKIFKNETNVHRKELHKTSFLKWLFSKEAVLRSLIIFNALFALQTVMDITYLWQGAELPEDLSYAEYTHKGAYPLIFTALLAGAFTIISQQAGKEVSESSVIKGLIYCWITQNIFLVASSVFRLLLYVEFYSLTYLRVSAFIWMGLVALGLIWIIVSIIWKKSDIWLININALSLLTVLYVVSFINIGGIIATYNVNDYMNSYTRTYDYDNDLDLDYLVEIGPASLPAIQKLVAHEQESKRPRRQESIEQTIENLMTKLIEKNANWREWTYQNHQLLKQTTNQ